MKQRARSPKDGVLPGPLTEHGSVRDTAGSEGLQMDGRSRVRDGCLGIDVVALGNILGVPHDLGRGLGVRSASDHRAGRTAEGMR